MTGKVSTNQQQKKVPSGRVTLDAAPHCPYCNSDDVYGITRVVGYFSVIDNWNSSKQAEFKRRQKGNYWHKQLD